MPYELKALYTSTDTKFEKYSIQQLCCLLYDVSNYLDPEFNTYVYIYIIYLSLG